MKNNDYIFKCVLHIDGINESFDGEGKTKNDAKMKCACKAYDYLMNSNLISSIRNDRNDFRTRTLFIWFY